MRRWWLFGALVVLWILAWGRITFANLVSGILITVVLLAAFPPRRGPEVVRAHALGMVRLVVSVAKEVIVANLAMTRQILARRPDYQPGVLAHRLLRPSEIVATVMSSIIALSPGTMTIDVSDDSSVIYVHFFDLRDVAAARRLLTRLEERIHRALSESPAEPASVDPSHPSEQRQEPT